MSYSTMTRPYPLSQAPAIRSCFTEFAPGSFRCLPYVRRRLAGGMVILPRRCRSTRVRWSCVAYASPHAEQGGGSWFPLEVPEDSCGGWYVHLPDQVKEKGGLGSLATGIAAWAGVLLFSFSCFCLAKKGYKLQISIPLHQLTEIFKPSSSAENPPKDTDVKKHDDAHIELKDESKDKNYPFDQTKETITDRKIKYMVTPPTIDTAQQEALSLLQRLEIMEKDVKPNGLCTRREYARWLIKANYLLERNPKNRIVPSLLMAGPVVQSFDDVNVDDPDFPFIQAIGETGIVPSKLSAGNYIDGRTPQAEERWEFSPESLITRLDLITWKLHLEHRCIPDIEEKMIRENVGFMDLRKVNLEVLGQLFMDTLAGDRSIVRRVFGNIRRFQPQKPVTNAQVAVALISGRMVDAIQTELSQMEVERLTRMANIKEIRSDLMHKGDIRRYWEVKLEQEKMRGLEVQQELQSSLQNLDTAKLIHKKEIENQIREKAALDCQKRLLSVLKKEVDEMHEKLAKEKAIVAEEQRNLEVMLNDLHRKQDAVMEAKSILEAEKEAIRILRTWVEDGARQSQFRAKVLETAVQRWKWDNQAGLPTPPEE